MASTLPIPKVGPHVHVDLSIQLNILNRNISTLPLGNPGKIRSSDALLD
jgi:hypothetical protein